MRTAMSFLSNETVARCVHRSGHSALITGVAVTLAPLIGLTACATKTDQSATKEAMPSIAAAPAPPAATQKEPAPQTLANVGEFGENIYDAAKAGKWSEAQTKLTELKDAMKTSGATLSKSSEQQNKLQGLVASLDTSIGKKAKSTTMRDANQVMLKSADIAGTMRSREECSV